MKQNVSGGTVAAIVVVVLAVIGFFAWKMFGKPKAEPPKETELTGGSAMMNRNNPQALQKMQNDAMQHAMQGGGAGTGRPPTFSGGRPGMGGQGGSSPTSGPPGPAGGNP